MTNCGKTGVGAARRALWLLAFPAVLLSTACRDGGITSDEPNGQFGRQQDQALTGNPDAGFETLTLCKEWTNAADIPVVFDVTVDPDDLESPPGPSTEPKTLTATGSFECRLVASFAGPTTNVQPADLLVVENVPAGATLLDIQVTTIVRGGATVGDYNPTTDVAAGTFSADLADDNVGFKVVYVNQLDPPGGGEGCTPGYWKNHAGIFSQSKGGQKKPSAWEGYSPTELYDDVFGVDSSFGGTLIDALKRGGGGENALGRHAVAALLNAANGGVSYAFTTAQIIAIVQGAYASGDFTGAKDQLASENEQGCPL